MTKPEIRCVMRQRRRAVSPSERSAASDRVCRQLLAMHLAGPVAVYLATRDEIDLSAFIGACGIGVVAPRWNGTEYELAALDGCRPDDLAAGPHGIAEPPRSARCVSSADVATWIVPGLAFARDGTRLGYGGGWYDRMMAGAGPDARKIGVGYAFQLVDELPCEIHDIKVDACAI